VYTRPNVGASTPTKTHQISYMFSNISNPQIQLL
jgi:hypothetical protein